MSRHLPIRPAVHYSTYVHNASIFNGPVIDSSSPLRSQCNGRDGRGRSLNCPLFSFNSQGCNPRLWMLSRFTVLTSFVIIARSCKLISWLKWSVRVVGYGRPGLTERQRGLSATLIIEDSNCSNEAAARKINVENDCWKLPCERKTWSLIVCFAFNYFEAWFSVVQLRICREGW